MVFHWSLNKKNVSRTLLSILADPNNAVACIIIIIEMVIRIVWRSYFLDIKSSYLGWAEYKQVSYGIK